VLWPYGVLNAESSNSTRRRTGSQCRYSEGIVNVKRINVRGPLPHQRISAFVLRQRAKTKIADMAAFQADNYVVYLLTLPLIQAYLTFASETSVTVPVCQLMLMSNEASRTTMTGRNLRTGPYYIRSGKTPMKIIR